MQEVCINGYKVFALVKKCLDDDQSELPAKMRSFQQGFMQEFGMVHGNPSHASLRHSNL